MTSKDQAFRRFKEYRAYMERQFGTLPMKIICSDNGGSS